MVVLVGIIGCGEDAGGVSVPVVCYFVVVVDVDPG